MNEDSLQRCSMPLEKYFLETGLMHETRSDVPRTIADCTFVPFFPREAKVIQRAREKLYN